MNVIMDFLRTADVFSWQIISILIAVGFFVGFVNTIAGGATALSYMLFMGMGMPANVANGTTRLGVTLQFLASSIVYNKAGYLDKKKGIQIGIPVALGSIGGAQVAASLNVKAFEICLAGALLVMLFFLFYDSKKFLEEQTEKLEKNINWKVWLIFLFIGFYGGFTHIGVGIFILVAAALLVGFDLLHANAVKQFAVMMYAPLALLVFILNKQVVWAVASIYAIGNVVGALLATKLAITWGANFIRWFLALIIFIFAFYLLYKNFC